MIIINQRIKDYCRRSGMSLKFAGRNLNKDILIKYSIRGAIDHTFVIRKDNTILHTIQYRSKYKLKENNNRERIEYGPLNGTKLD